MKPETAAQNLLSAYILLKGASENLEFLYQFRRDYKSKEFIQAVKEVREKTNFFCGKIEKTLISKIPKEQFDIIQEQSFEILEQLDKLICEVK
jgi:hypothetical protein